MPSHTHGDMSTLVDGLRATLRGTVIDPTHADYDEARSVWNGLIDRRPAVIARCADAADVAQAVQLARRFRPPVSVRGGGHQVAGSAVCDGGLVIDLSAMRGVAVDPDTRTARVEGGATWGDVDAATQRFGLAVPGGEVSTTGVAGFTLGGGMALSMRRFGLACDNLRSLEVVTADGEVRTVDATQHADLFWAARGGGRGIGVVTAFEFDLAPLGPDVAVATVLYPYEEAERILRTWRVLAPATPDTVTPQLILWSVPPDPAVPTALHGEPCVIVTALFAGPPDEAEDALAPLRSIVTPLHDLSGVVPYVDLQSSVDDLFPHGNRYFMKSLGMDDLSDPVIEALLTWDARRPTPETLTAIRTLGGAVGRVGADESAYPHRGDRFNVSIDAGWSDPTQDDAAIAWARGMWNALQPFSSGSVYLNFAGLDGDAGDVRERVFGANAARLDAVRAAYDPEGLFRTAAQRP